MQKVLTDGYLRALAPPATGRLEISDTRCGGLVLRVTAAGVKSWSFRFRDRITQAPLRVTIGRYPDVGLSAARGAADGIAKPSRPVVTLRRRSVARQATNPSARLPSAI
jgi:hypothetical protein